MTRARNIAGFSTITTTPSPVHVGPIGVLTATRIDGEINVVDITSRDITAQGIGVTNLQVSGITTGLNVSGIITAQNGINFNGTSTGLNVSGVGTIATLSVTGNANIAGVLTYEDVTNVDAVGVITARSGINITGGDLTIPDAIIHSADTNTRIRFPASDTFTVETAGSERLRIDSDGRLLVGATTNNSASARSIFRGFAGDGGTGQGILHLEVNRTTTNCGADEGLGSIRFASNEGHIGAEFSASAESAWTGSGDLPTYFRFRSCADGSGSLTERLRIESTGVSKFKNFGGGQIWLGGDSAHTAKVTVTDNNGTGNGNFIFTGPSGEHLRVISSGKVGIGITNPTGQLHISSGTSGDCELKLESDTDNNEENDNPRIVFIQDGGSHQAAIEQLNNELTLSNSVASNGGIVFKTNTVSTYTNAVERMRITDAGDVVVNDTSATGNVHPDTKFHVKGGITFRELTSASEGALPAITQWSRNGTAQDLVIGSRSNTGNLLFYTGNAGTDGDWGASSNAERLRIDNTGRLVVGGSSGGTYHQDGDELNIYSTGNTGMSIFSGTSSLGSLFFADDNSDVHGQRRGAVQYNHSDNSLAFWTNASERMRITSGGDLRLNGGAIYGDDTALPTFAIANTSGNSNNVKITLGESIGADNGGITFYTAGSSSSTARMRIRGNNNFIDILSTYTLRFNDGALTLNHDGNHSYIQDAGTGNLKLVSNGTAVQIEKSGGENMAVFRTDAGVELFYNNVKCAETIETNGIKGLLVGEKSDINTSVTHGELIVRKSYGGNNNATIEQCARITIITNEEQGGGNGYGGALFFGTQDVGTADQYNPKLAAIGANCDGADTANANKTGSLDFYTHNGTSLGQRMKINFNGSIGAPSGTNIYNASDSRLKKNIESLPNGLNLIKELRPVSFNWIDGFCDEEKETLYGFIAQEVETVDSNLIEKFGDGTVNVGELKVEGALRVKEKQIIPLLVKAIQELSARVEELERQ